MARDFDGLTQYGITSSPWDLSSYTGGISFGMWLNVGDQSGLQFVCEHTGDGLSFDGGFGYYLDGNVTYAYWRNTSTSRNQYRYSGIHNIGQWQHVLVVCNPSGLAQDRIRVYIDGSKATVNQYSLDQGGGSFTPANANYHLMTRGAGSFKVHGSQSNHAIWHHVFTDSDAAVFANHVSPELVRPLDLIEHWQLNGNSTTAYGRFQQANFTLTGNPPPIEGPLITQPGPSIMLSADVAPPVVSNPIVMII